MSLRDRRITRQFRDIRAVLPARKPGPQPILPGDKRLEKWECAQRSGIGLDAEQTGLVLAYVRTLEAGLRQKATREEGL